MADHALHRETIPSRVGDRYVLQEELGRGGMASVFRARDEVLDREVAVKLLHAHLATDQTFLDRFRREARAAAALNHPNVVAVHDWGETDDGAFLVLQLIDGVSLRDVLRVRTHLPPDEAVAVLTPVAHGLGAAHRAGLVHRDVKPENLLLGRDGTVRVSDFGLARASASATSTFGGDVLVGSPHYLAPEAVRSEPVDARADVYALGVVIYECLVGEPPHQAESPFATAMAHIEHPVPPPSDARPDVPSWLDEVVATATAREADDRYADATELARALSRSSEAADQQSIGPTAAAAAAVHNADVAAGGGSSHTAGPADTSTSSPAPAPPGGPPDGVAGGTAGGAVPPPPPPTADEDRHDTAQLSRGRRRRWPLVGLLMLVLLLGAAAVAWDQLVAPVTPVPNVAGQPVEQARDELVEAGFEVSIDPERPHDLAVPEDHVLAQEPTGELRRGGTVVLVVSAGPAQLPVPDVVGDPVDEAERTLRADGFDVAFNERHDEEVPADRVIATDPAADQTVDEASTITVVVSLGPTPIEVPELLGTPVDDARDELADRELDLEVVGRQHDPDMPAESVLSQAPGAGQTLTRGDVVEVVLSDGPEPIVVPAVRGEQAEDAVAEIEALGLDVEVERSGGFGALFNPGQVFDQDPAPGARLLPGETVLLFAYE